MAMLIETVERDSAWTVQTIKLMQLGKKVNHSENTKGILNI